jgi:hypothetical protein
MPTYLLAIVHRHIEADFLAHFCLAGCAYLEVQEIAVSRDAAFTFDFSGVCREQYSDGNET